MSQPNDAAEHSGSTDCSSALQILLEEWHRMQPGRYRTLTESDEDHAFYVGFNHAIEVLKVRGGFIEPPKESGRHDQELKALVRSLDIPF